MTKKDIESLKREFQERIEKAIAIITSEEGVQIERLNPWELANLITNEVFKKENTDTKPESTPS